MILYSSQKFSSKPPWVFWHNKTQKESVSTKSTNHLIRPVFSDIFCFWICQNNKINLFSLCKLGIYFRLIFFFLFSKLIYKINLFSFFANFIPFWFPRIGYRICNPVSHNWVRPNRGFQQNPKYIERYPNLGPRRKKIHLSLMFVQPKVRSPFKIWISGCAQSYISQVL